MPAARRKPRACCTRPRSAPACRSGNRSSRRFSGGFEQHGPRSFAMLFAAQLRPDSASLERTLERRIHERTRGRIRGIQVAIGDNRVTVRGVSPSYYIKQLAIHALLQNIEPKE